MSLALALGRELGRRPIAVCGFSGFIPEVDGWELDDARPLPPVAYGHGTLDPVVRYIPAITSNVVLIERTMLIGRALIDAVLGRRGEKARPAPFWHLIGTNTGTLRMMAPEVLGAPLAQLAEQLTLNQ